MLHGQVDIPCVSIIQHDLFSLLKPVHRILQASASGNVNAYILCPSAVYGPGTGPVGRASLFFKLYVGSVLQQRVPYVIGEGTNRFEFVSEQITQKHKKCLIFTDLLPPLLNRYTSMILLLFSSLSFLMPFHPSLQHLIRRCLRTNGTL